MSEEKPKRVNEDVEELTQVLDVVSDRIPRLITALRDTIYSEAAGREMGKAVGAFYRELIQAGIEPREALSMARSYISALQDVLKKSTAEGTKEIRIKKELSKPEEE